MAKTLVIKGADYSANSLDKVMLGDIPCEGISLDESSYSIKNTDPVEIGFTVTPANTTDLIEWESSNTDVVTVEDGILTIVGIGTATVTVSCGEFSDSAQIDVELSYIPNFKFYIIGDESASFLSCSELGTRLSAFGTGSQEGQYKVLESDGKATNQPVIVLPKNTNYVEISVDTTSALYNGNEMHLYWAKDEWCEVAYQPEGALKISSEPDYNGRTYPQKTFAVPSGADSMVFCARLNSTPAEGTNPNDLAQSIGLSIKFLESIVNN